MKKQAGFTLIEIMIALLIGLIIIAATITIYISTIKGSSDTLKSARLNHDLESAMSLMVNDIRRAGYWGRAIAGADSSTNPFTTGAANIQIPIATCILYSYDAGSPPDGIPDNGEYYGFKFESGAIRIRSADAAETTTDCTGAGWNTLTVEESVSITGLRFTSAYKCLDNSAIPPAVASFNSTCAAAALPVGHKAVESRQIDITLTGSVVGDAAVTKTLISTVKVRNDRIFTQ